MAIRNLWARLPANSRARWVFPAMLMILCVLLAYLPALRDGFIWDDDAYVTENTTLHDLHGLHRIWFEVGAVPQYYPMVHTTFWLEYHLWGLKPVGFHLINVLLHATAAVLLWQVLRRLEVRGAWLAALIFGVHPIEVESVAWITERKNVLSAVFYFTAVLAYFRFAARGEQTHYRWFWYGGALMLFVAALWSKTVTCSLPAALLLVCWWKKEQIRTGDVLPLLPFFAVGMGLGFLTMWMEKHHVGAQGTDWSLTFADRCLIAGRALWFYAGKLAWPTHLTFIYPRWTIEPTVWWQWLFPLAAIVVIIGLWLARHRTGKGPLVAVLFFAGTLGPALGFVNVYPMRFSFVADHFQYLAGIGLITLCAAGLARLPWVFPAVLVVGLSLLTWQQTGIYRDQEVLWRDTLAKNPGCWMAYSNLGSLLQNQGRLKEASEDFQQALRLKSDDPELWYNLGDALAAEGRLEDAIGCYHKAIAMNPRYYKALINLGTIFANAGQYDEAIECFQRANRVQPGTFDTLKNLGSALAATSRFDEAIGAYRQALQVSPNHPETLVYLGMTLGQSGRNREAVDAYRAALKLNPDLPEALNNLALILATSSEDNLRNGPEAVQLAGRACQFTQYRQPQFIETLAAAYAEARRFQDAQAVMAQLEHLATAAGQTGLAERYHRLLERYRAGQPLREQPVSKSPTPSPP